MGMFHPEAIRFRSGACEKVLALSWASGPKAEPSCLKGVAPTMGATELERVGAKWVKPNYVGSGVSPLFPSL